MPPTRQDFVATAAILRDQIESTRDLVILSALARTAEAFAHEYAEANPNFSHTRFYTACGLTATGKPREN